MLSLVMTAALALTQLPEISQSHIDANVPSEDDFDTLLERDLTAHLRALEGDPSLSVDYELFRREPTQSGVSYPKFYAWVRSRSEGAAVERGAVRLEAIEKRRFRVTDYFSEDRIREQPELIYEVFPVSICEDIERKLGIEGR